MTTTTPEPAAASASRSPGMHAAVLRIAALISGGLLMALEILAFRVIGKTFGSALRETSVVIAVFLTAMSLGYFAGGRVADRSPRMRTLTSVLLLAAVVMTFVPLLDGLISARVFESGLPAGLHSSVVTVALFFVPTLFLASVSPIAVRLLTDRVESTGRVVGSLSAISTIGSIAGSIGTAFILIDYFRSVQRTIYVLAFVAFLLAVVSAVPTAVEAQAEARKRSLLITAFVVVAAIFGAGLFVASPVGEVALRHGSQRVVYERDSAYHHIRVVDSSLMRTLYFDSTPQSRIRLDDWSSGGFPYTDLFHFATALNPDAKRVLFIGVGGGTGPTAFARLYPGLEVDAVDVDAAVIDVARRYFGLRAGPRLRLHVADGRTFVKRRPERYDVIVVDAYTQNRYGATIPAHLTTVQFFQECAEHMTEDGVIVFNSAFGSKSRLTAAVSRTLLRVFPHQAAFSDSNTVLFASQAPIPRDRAGFTTLVRNAPAYRDVLENRVASLDTIDVKGVPVLTDDYAPVDLLVRE